MLIGIIPYAHQLLTAVVSEGAAVVDATCGNGNDSLFLSDLVGDKGTVFSFDVQSQAIERTNELLTRHGKENVHVIHDSHEHINEHIPSELKGKIQGAIFNLGYLPRSDKRVITQGHSTLSAIEQLLEYIGRGGRIVLVVYHGHEGGK